MSQIKTTLAFLLLLVSASNHAQLGFCTGSKGEPLFTENFGNGTTYGPALPAGTTTYPFISGAPQDGQYTLFYHSSQYTTWHYSLDHTPDATNGPNGKMLLMNAHAVTSGDFYKKTVTGLCVNTTFEFSAWLMNVYNPNTNYCGAGQIPINVRFEIWNASETVLLGSGNTGNIMGTPTPLWQQFALVFTTVSETTVVLKMKNNGLGGCGNDLAIDDIEFRACGDLTTVSSPSVTGNTYTTCTNPVSLQLNAATVGPTTYFYQWQSSTNNMLWNDIPGATNATFTTPNLSSRTYFRVRAAQDAANLSNIFCSAISDVFTVDVLPTPAPAVSNGDQTICTGSPIPALSVNALAGTSVNWYSAATSGTLLQANSTSYLPTAPGTYYAEIYNMTSNCIGSPRTAVSLNVVTLPNATITVTPAICAGNTASVNFSGTPNAVVTYTVDGGPNQTITLNASGVASFTTPVLTANSTYVLVDVSLSTCNRPLSDTATVTVNNTATATVSGATQVCSGSSATVAFNGTPNATVVYTVNAGANQTVNLNAAGTASVVLPNVTTTIVYTLISVSLGGVCAQTLSQSITIAVVPVPTAAITANPPTICANQNSTINFNGTPNAVLTYTVDGGPNQTITLGASGTASIIASGLTSNTTYTLLSAASPVLATCSTTLNNAVTVTVHPLATASISSVSQVCAGTSATVNFIGTPNATVTYTQNGGSNQTVVLNAGGTASVVIPSVTATTVYALVNVALAGVCAQTLTQSVTVDAVALPTASVSVNPPVICADQTTTVNFTGTPNAVVAYKIGGGANQTINLNASGLANFTASGLTSNTTYTLVSATSPILNTCSTSLSGAATVTVNALPTASISSNAPVCNGASATVTFNGTPNAIVAYSAGSTSQTVTLGASGTVSVVVPNVTAATTYSLSSVTSTGANGCTRALTQSITVSAIALLTAAVNVNPSVICDNQSSTINFTGTPNAIVTYTNGGTSQTITLDASGAASVSTGALSANTTYQLVGVSLGTCNRAVTGSASVTVHPIPDVVYSGVLNYCTGEQVLLNFSSAVAGTTFNWTVSQNGTTGAVAGSGNQIAQTVALQNTNAGTLIYTVTPEHNGCAGIPITITVTIHPLPVPQISDGVICLKTNAPPSSQFYTLDTQLDPATHSFQWLFGGLLIPGATASTYDASQIGVYTVTATNSAGCVSDPVDAVVGEMAQGERLIVQQSETFSDNPTITVTVVGGDGPFSYRLDNGAFQSGNVFQSVMAGTHTITVIDEFCTELTATVTLIDYPKFFTPNGDGYNETWNVAGIPNAVIRIFDRYGKLLKEISSDGLGWNGTFNGRLLPATDYWFTIDYAENGADKTFKAHFTLKR